MKFVLASYGSRGDVEPFAAVARELLRRGHGLQIAVPPYMLGFVESAGLTATPFGPDPPGLHGMDGDRRAGTTQNPLSMVGEVLGHLTRAWAEWGTTLTQLADGADLLLTGRGEQGLATHVAEYYQIPLAALHFFPGGDWRPEGLLGVRTKEMEAAMRRQLGLPESTGELPQSLEIQAYDELCFPGVAAEWAEQGSRRPFVGALTLELPTDADDEVLSWIAAGTPPIYFGFGSGMKFASSADTVAMIGAVCAQLGERALVCVGADDFREVPRFDHVKVVPAVNHAAILPACRAAVHHGGAGTTAAGLRAGIPTLILWLGVDDQQVWAAAVERLKVGAGRPFWTTTVQSLAADLSLILTPECAIKSLEVAAQMTKAAESVARTADLLEAAAT